MPVTQERLDEIMEALADAMDVLNSLSPAESIAVHADALEMLADPMTDAEREFYAEIVQWFDTADAAVN